jgi:hypothetical protein
MRSASQQFSPVPETPPVQHPSPTQQSSPLDSEIQTATTSHFGTTWTFTGASDASVRIISSYGHADTILRPDETLSWPPTSNYIVAVNALLRGLTNPSVPTEAERQFMEDILLQILEPAPEVVEIITWLEEALGFAPPRVKEAMKYILCLRHLKV